MTTEISLESLLDDILNDRPLPDSVDIEASFGKKETKQVLKSVDQVKVREVVRDFAILQHGGAGNAVMALPDLFTPEWEGDEPVVPELAAEPVPHAVKQAAAQLAHHPMAGRMQTRPPAPLEQVPNKVFVDQPEEGDEGISKIVMPSFDASSIMDTLDLRNYATLVTLNTSRWMGKIKDKQASQDVAAANDASASAFNTRKNLLAGADDGLRAICKTLDSARTEHYRMTVPWSTTSMEDTGKRSGGRLLPNSLFMDYTTVMAHKKQEMEAALAAFVPAYPAMVEESKKQLGKRFDAREYPNAESIRKHFDLSFDFQPIPAGDDFKGLADKQVQALAAKLNRNLATMTKHAMEDLWARMYRAVEKVVERLSSPDKVFHASTIQNLRDISRLAGHLNVTNDARVEKIRVKIESRLCSASAEDIRKNGVLRQEIAAHAASILEEMSA